MKRLSVLIIAVLMAFSATAQENKEYPKYEARLGWGGYPNTDAVYSSYPQYIDFAGENGSLSDLYADYGGPVYMTGAIAGEFSFYLTRWFSLGALFSYNGIFADRYGIVTSEKTGREHGVSLLLAPQARFNYFSRPNVRLYSAVSLGIGYNSFRDNSDMSVAGQLTFFGVTFGQKLFGFVELGAGSIYFGGMAGIGYRF